MLLLNNVVWRFATDGKRRIEKSFEKRDIILQVPALDDLRNVFHVGFIMETREGEEQSHHFGAIAVTYFEISGSSSPYFSWNRG